jgi:hypothetical protein
MSKVPESLFDSFITFVLVSGPNAAPHGTDLLTIGMVGLRSGQHSFKRNARNDEFAPEAEYWEFATSSGVVGGISAQPQTATSVWHGVGFGRLAIWFSHLETSRFGLSPFTSCDIGM